MARRLARSVLALAILSPPTVSLLPSGAAVAAEATAAPAVPELDVVPTWSQSLPDTNGAVIGSSPALVHLPTGPAVVFGDTAGKVWALQLATGQTVPGWPKGTFDGGPVDGPVSASGSTVFVPVGDYATPYTGGYQAIGTPPASSWHRTVESVWLQGRPQSAVIAGLSVGVLQGQTSVFAGSLGQDGDAFRTGNGAQVAGFPFLQFDSNQTTAAVADLYGKGQVDIIEGGAQTGNPALHIADGGHVRVINQTGNLICDYHALQPVSGSPAVGQFLIGGQVGIVAGTVPLFDQPGADQLLGLTSHCEPQWATTLDGLVDGAPAVVNALGNHALQIAVTAHDSKLQSGTTYLINGANGSVIWKTRSLGAAPGGPVSVDLGNGYQDLVVAGIDGTQILDGRTGSVIWQTPSSNNGVPLVQNSALITDDPNGSVGITLVGYNVQPFNTRVVHYEVVNASGRRVSEAGGWPEFHHDPQLTGSSGMPPPNLQVPCHAPRNPQGYYLAAADGGVFGFGNLPFCGSTGGVWLAQPVVGLASTPDKGGYWLVAADGGVFAFGDARFYGSTGAEHLNRPIVGMAATTDGRGYWLVASDGGVFAFGDARFYGSAGGSPLEHPAVGLIPNPQGGGYWLTTANGAVLAYGTALPHGSTGGTRLARPIVAMATIPTGMGYLLIAADGGIFAFGDARFEGSTGGLTLSRPVVAGAETADGTGYWLVGADGGVFAFGHAPFYGSTGRVRLAQPVVAISAAGV
jgi:hypothetical protein